MIKVEKLENGIDSLVSLLVSGKADYIVNYKFMKGEGFALHMHPTVAEYIILKSGIFALKYGKKRNTISEMQLDTRDGILLIIVPSRVLHALVSLVDGSEYIVVKDFNDDMLF